MIYLLLILLPVHLKSPAEMSASNIEKLNRTLLELLRAPKIHISKKLNINVSLLLIGNPQTM